MLADDGRSGSVDPLESRRDLVATLIGRAECGCE